MRTNRGCRCFRVVVTEVKEATSTFTVTLRRLELRIYLIQFTFYMLVGDQIKMLLSFLTAEVAQVLQWTLPSWELHNCDALHLEPVVNPAQKLMLLQGWIWHMLSVALQEYCLCAPGRVASKRSFKSFLLLLYRISNDPGLPILDSSSSLPTIFQPSEKVSWHFFGVIVRELLALQKAFLPLI